MKYARIKLNSTFLAGLHSNSMSFSKYTLDKKTELKIGLLSYYRTKAENYMLYPYLWNINKLNNRIDLSLEHKYNFKNISALEKMNSFKKF